MLDSELRKRIHTPDAEELITKIRQSARLVTSLPPDIQQIARDSYAFSLNSVFTLAACTTFLAYLVRLPIPDKELEHRPQVRKRPSTATVHDQEQATTFSADTPIESEDEDEDGNIPPDIPERIRRLSTFEPMAGVTVMDLESDKIGGSARRR